MAGERAPRVSIGLPVWNGESFLGQAIDSLLAQTFVDFELIISDNASTDQTEAICRDRALQDARVQYHRNATNIGLQANTQRVLDLATAPYFMWASHDDLWDPTYIAKMVAELDRQPECVMAGSNAASIDEHGRVGARFDNWSMYSPRALDARVRRLLGAPPRGGHATFIYALMRTEVIKQLRVAEFENVRMLNRGKYAWDKRALFRLVFRGRFYVSRETLFFHRDLNDWPAAETSPGRVSRQLARLRRAVAYSRDLHGYYDELREIVIASSLRTPLRLRLVGESWLQEVRYQAGFYGSRVRG